MKRRKPTAKGRVLAVTHTLQYDGAPQSMLQIARALSKDGYKIVLLSGRDGPLRGEYKKIKAAVASPQMPFIPTEVWNPYYTETYKHHFSDLTELIKSHNVDVVFANTLQTHWAIHAAALLNLPSVWSIRESINDLSELPATRRTAISLASRVVFCSEETRKVYEPLNKGHFETVFNGIDLEVVEKIGKSLSGRNLRKKLGLPKDGRVISIIGTPAARKGHHVLLEVAREIVREEAKTHFLFVGVPENDTDYIHHLKAQISDGDLSSRFTLAKRTNNVFPFIAVSDIVVVPSFNESFPRVTLEAMAFSKPIVAFDAWGIREQLVHEESALLVPPGDRAAFADAMKRLITQPQEAERMARNAYSRLKENYTIDRMTGPYVEIFGELMSPAQPRKFHRVPSPESDALSTIRTHLEEGSKAGLKRAERKIAKLDKRSEEILRVLEMLKDVLLVSQENSFNRAEADDEEDIRDLAVAYDSLFLRLLRENAGIRLAAGENLFSRITLVGEHLEGLNIENICSEQADFSGAVLKDNECAFSIFRELDAGSMRWICNQGSLTQFFNSVLNESIFERSGMDGAAFFETQLIRARFDGCSLRNAYFYDCLLGGVEFDKCDITGTVFNHCHLERAVLTDCEVEGVSLVDCVVDNSTSEQLRQRAACRKRGAPLAKLWVTHGYRQIT